MTHKKKHLMRADDHVLFNYQTHITAEAQPDYSCTLRYVGQWRVVTSEILTLGLKKSSQRRKSSTGTSLANILNKP